MCHAVICVCGQKMSIPENALGRMGTCVRCGQRIRISVENTVSFDATPAPEFSRTANRQGVESPFDAAPGEPCGEPTGDRCVRCRRGFRGGWDRNETADGVLCHICANHIHVLAAPAQAPVITPDWKNVEDPFAEQGWGGISRRQPEAQRTAEPSTWLEHVGAFFDTKAGIITFIVLSGVIMAAVWFFPVAEYMAAFFAPAEGASAELSPAWMRAVLITQWVLSAGGRFFWLYFGLFWIGKLPNDTFGKNLIAVGGVALALYVIGLLGFFTPYLGIAIFIFQYGLLMSIYDLEFREIVTLVCISFLIKPLLWAVNAFVFGVLSAIAL